MTTRYVAWNEERGVHLGLSVWSKDPGLKSTSAPTYADQSEAEVAIPIDGTPFRLIEVWPDLPDNRASQNACSNALLPRW